MQIIGALNNSFIYYFISLIYSTISIDCRTNWSLFSHVLWVKCPNQRKQRHTEDWSRWFQHQNRSLKKRKIE